MEGSGYHVLCAMSICRTNSRLLCRPLFIVAVGVISGSHHANPTLIFRLAAFSVRPRSIDGGLARRIPCLSCASVSRYNCANTPATLSPTFG
jgi:hypothetical protein